MLHGKGIRWGNGRATRKRKKLGSRNATRNAEEHDYLLGEGIHTGEPELEDREKCCSAGMFTRKREL